VLKGCVIETFFFFFCELLFTCIELKQNEGL